jgi:predicted nucleic-acid-binding protein
MKRYLIDTNCLVSFVTDRNVNQQKLLTRYFEGASNFKYELIVLSNVITEFVYVLDKIYGVHEKIISAILYDLAQTPGFIIKNYFNLNSILSLWPKDISDYGDAIIASCAKEEKLSIITFDHSFVKQLKVCNISVEQKDI